MTVSIDCSAIDDTMLVSIDCSAIDNTMIVSIDCSAIDNGFTLLAITQKQFANKLSFYLLQLLTLKKRLWQSLEEFYGQSY